MILSLGIERSEDLLQAVDNLLGSVEFVDLLLKEYIIGLVLNRIRPLAEFTVSAEDSGDILVSGMSRVPSSHIRRISGNAGWVLLIGIGRSSASKNREIV